DLPDAPVLPGGHDAIVLHIAFGDVLRVGVQACEHGVYAGPDELSGLHIVHIVDVDVLVELVEDLQVLPHLEVVVARRNGEGASGGDGHYDGRFLPTIEQVLHVDAGFRVPGRGHGRPKDGKIGSASW